MIIYHINVPHREMQRIIKLYLRYAGYYYLSMNDPFLLSININQSQTRKNI